MYTPIQLEAIEMFGRKDLTFWCIVKVSGYIKNSIKIKTPLIWSLVKYTTPHYTGHCWNYYLKFQDKQEIMKCWSNFCEILWHIPHLEDLFRVAEEKWIYISISPEITRVYKEFWWEPIEIVLVTTLPLLDQPNLEEIINLFK